MYCLICREAKLEGARFCPDCGSRLVPEKPSEDDQATLRFDPTVGEFAPEPPGSADFQRLGDPSLPHDDSDLDANLPPTATSPERAHFVIHTGTVSQEPIFPKHIDELAYSIQVENQTRSERFLHSHGSLRVGSRAVLSGSVYGREMVQIGRACRVNGHIVSSGPIQIGIGTIVDGYLLSDSLAGVEISDFCEAHGIIAKGDVRVGKRARVPFIRAFGNVILGSDFEGDSIEAQDVDVGRNGRVREITASGDLFLQDGVQVEHLAVADELKIGQAVEIRSMNTLLIARGSLPQTSPLRLGNSPVTLFNRFTSLGDRLTPAKEDQAQVSRAVTVITSLIDHQLFETISTITGLELRIPPNQHRP